MSARGLSRRRFLETAAGSTALALVAPSAALPRTRTTAHPDVLRDYVGRLCYNENPLGPSPLALTALADAAGMAHRYPDWFADSLRSDLAAKYGIGTNQIIAGCGGTEILRLSALAFADPSGNVVCPYPSYSQFSGDAGFLGAEVRTSSLDGNYRIDLDHMASLVDANTSAVCITNPNNPTGTVLAAADLAAFIDALPPQVVTVIDEAYHEFVHDAGYASAIDQVTAGKPVIVIRTFSKAFGLAGARIGYAIGRSTDISQMNAWHLFATVSRLGLDAARAALDDSQHISDTVALNDQAKQFSFDSFDTMGLQYIPSETSFFMVDVGVPAGPVANELSARGIRVRTGWGMPQHLRVSTGTMEEMQNFIDELTDILGISGVAGGAPPRVTSLGANFPNPFRSSTQGTFALATGGHVSLEVFNVRGQLVRTLVDGRRGAGRHEFNWDGRNQQGAPAASGSYFYRLRHGDVTQTRRMILIR